MKRIYLVRHGQSEGNVHKTLGTDSSLSEKGKIQAEFVAERFTRLPIEVVISSTMKRAQETAGFISKKLKVPLEHSDWLIEKRRASETRGKSFKDESVQKVEKEINDNLHISGYRFSDEENFDELKKRALKVLEYLEKRKEEHIVVVTHGYFLRIIFATVIHGEKLSGEVCRDFINSLHHENTGISVLRFDQERIKPWWLWVWNDHAHLSELEGEK